MITFPKAKINLGLRIIRKRADGYHDIESIFYPIGLSDALEYKVAPLATADEITVSGLPIPESGSDNLVVKAINLLRRKFALPFLKVYLHKAILPTHPLR